MVYTPPPCTCSHDDIDWVDTENLSDSPIEEEKEEEEEEEEDHAPPAEEKESEKAVVAAPKRRTPGFVLLLELVQDYFPLSPAQKLLPAKHLLWACIHAFCRYVIVRLDRAFGHLHFHTNNGGELRLSRADFTRLITFVYALVDVRDGLHSTVLKWFSEQPEIAYDGSSFQVVPAALGLEVVMQRIPNFMSQHRSVVPGKWACMADEVWNTTILAKAKSMAKDDFGFDELKGQRPGCVRAGKWIDFQNDKYVDWLDKLDMAVFPVNAEDFGLTQVPHLYTLIRYWNVEFGRSKLAHPTENAILLHSLSELSALEFLANFIMDQRHTLIPDSVLANGLLANDLVFFAKEMHDFLCMRRDCSTIAKALKLMAPITDWKVAEPTLSKWFLEVLSTYRTHARGSAAVEVATSLTRERVLLYVVLAWAVCATVLCVMFQTFYANEHSRYVELNVAHIGLHAKFVALDRTYWNLVATNTAESLVCDAHVRQLNATQNATRRQFEEVMALIDGLKQNVTHAFALESVPTGAVNRNGSITANTARDTKATSDLATAHGGYWIQDQFSIV